MKTNRFAILSAACACLLGAPVTQAVTNVFFTTSQTSTLVVSNINAVTIRSGDYLFTYSADGYWSSGGGVPTGRFFSIFWPTGVQAQAITAGPSLGTGANIALKRADGKLFDLQAFTGKILLNTAGAGAAFEIMPLLNGNDAFNNPLQYDCTGYGGASFSYTTALASYDTYQIHMWGDFALTALTLLIAFGAGALGFNSLGQKRNEKPGLSWLGLAVATLCIPAALFFFFFWRTFAEAVLDKA